MKKTIKNLDLNHDLLFTLAMWLYCTRKIQHHSRYIKGHEQYSYSNVLQTNRDQLKLACFGRSAAENSFDKQFSALIKAGHLVKIKDPIRGIHGTYYRMSNELLNTIENFQGKLQVSSKTTKYFEALAEKSEQTKQIYEMLKGKYTKVSEIFKAVRTEKDPRIKAIMNRILSRIVKLGEVPKFLKYDLNVFQAEQLRGYVNEEFGIIELTGIRKLLKAA